MKSSPVSLFELTAQVKDHLHSGFLQPLWITAEINQFSKHHSGHCYLELVEKDLKTERIVASIRATIWASAYRQIDAQFKYATGQSLGEGIKVLVKVLVEFHEVYGISLNLRDIDPNYTLGDLAANKLQILRKLEETGVMNLNKELEMERVPQKIAVISSKSAAGYEDFIDQLKQNPQRIHFYTALFSAHMQGTMVSSSIINALDKIADHDTLFDAVVIIRGGGSKTDLHYFDDFDLAFNIAQFPLPVITGIGHERDESITDLVAHTKCKTPTAAAAFLIELGAEFLGELDWLYQRISTSAQQNLKSHRQDLKNMSLIGGKLSQQYLDAAKQKVRDSVFWTQAKSHQVLKKNQLQLKMLSESAESKVRKCLSSTKTDFDKMSMQLKFKLENNLNHEKFRLQGYQKDLEHANPVNILKKGYSVTFCNGKVVKTNQEIPLNAEFTTRLYEGSIKGKRIK